MKRPQVAAKFETGEWEPWFAWKPVRLKEGKNVWLAKVWRRWAAGGVGMPWYTDYTMLPDRYPRNAGEGKSRAQLSLERPL